MKAPRVARARARRRWRGRSGRAARPGGWPPGRGRGRASASHSFQHRRDLVVADVGRVAEVEGRRRRRGRARPSGSRRRAPGARPASPAAARWPRQTEGGERVELHREQLGRAGSAAPPPRRSAPSPRPGRPPAPGAASRGRPRDHGLDDRRRRVGGAVRRAAARAARRRQKASPRGSAPSAIRARSAAPAAPAGGAAPQRGRARPRRPTTRGRRARRARARPRASAGSEAERGPVGLGGRHAGECMAAADAPDRRRAPAHRIRPPAAGPDPHALARTPGDRLRHRGPPRGGSRRLRGIPGGRIGGGIGGAGIVGMIVALLVVFLGGGGGRAFDLGPRARPLPDRAGGRGQRRCTTARTR